MLRPRVRLLLVRERRDAALVVRPRALAEERREAVALEVGDRDERRVDGQLLVVHAEPVAVRVRVREEAGLEDRVRGGLDAGHEVRGRERDLLDLREVVLHILVQLDRADGLEREVGMWPDLGQVEDVELERLRLCGRHRLHVDRPGGEVALLDRLEELLSTSSRCLSSSQSLSFSASCSFFRMTISF